MLLAYPTGMELRDDQDVKDIGDQRHQAIVRLKELRLQRCWTQQQLATYAGVGLATVKQIETGRHPARLSTVQALAQALRVDSSELIGLHFK